eukprot:CAMPEP_0195538302 /NCGR_PEP_ID=MMETSP0794_2-20130614/49453_1 /TAXON_ID=515487 /ORGANISM="Stephanopyxis turris, Strain CCMP 815" /LENGTH=357 /DNA_ID=CAMNT_0040672271 /DNA_START=47 /DNA_END=1120 /DNA_ORIENTATION=+
MKFYGSLLALYALQSATAFVVHGPKAFTSKTSALSMSDPYANQASKIFEKSNVVLVQGGDTVKTWSLNSGAVKRVQVALRTEGRPLNADVELWQGPDNNPHSMQIYLENGLKRKAFTSKTSALSMSDPYANQASKIFEKSQPVLVQGGDTVKTWSLNSGAVKRVQVALQTEGRPLNADVELWQGPDNNPHSMQIYLENGLKRPFSAVVETPRGPDNTVRVRNTGPMEFPFFACVEPDTTEAGPSGLGAPVTVQGGALRTYAFEPNVESVQVLLKTDGRPLNSKIEVLQGPNNMKTVIDLYTEDGMERPFFAVFETPGSGYVFRILNTAPLEFPMSAWVEPYVIGKDTGLEPVVLGGF